MQQVLADTVNKQLIKEAKIQFFQRGSPSYVKPLQRQCKQPGRGISHHLFVLLSSSDSPCWWGAGQHSSLLFWVQSPSLFWSLPMLILSLLCRYYRKTSPCANKPPRPPIGETAEYHKYQPPHMSPWREGLPLLQRFQHRSQSQIHESNLCALPPGQHTVLSVTWSQSYIFAFKWTAALAQSFFLQGRGRSILLRIWLQVVIYNRKHNASRSHLHCRVYVKQASDISPSWIVRESNANLSGFSLWAKCYNSMCSVWQEITHFCFTSHPVKFYSLQDWNKWVL